jgi:hypothetical protein
MGLFDRLRGRDTTEEVACPRCGIAVPINALSCAACGWDPREVYRDESGLGNEPREGDRSA